MFLVLLLQNVPKVDNVKKLVPGEYHLKSCPSFFAILLYGALRPRKHQY